MWGKVCNFAQLKGNMSGNWWALFERVEGRRRKEESMGGVDLSILTKKHFYSSLRGGRRRRRKGESVGGDLSILNKKNNSVGERRPS